MKDTIHVRPLVTKGRQPGIILEVRNGSVSIGTFRLADPIDVAALQIAIRRAMNEARTLAAAK